MHKTEHVSLQDLVYNIKNGSLQDLLYQIEHGSLQDLVYKTESSSLQDLVYKGWHAQILYVHVFEGYQMLFFLFRIECIKLNITNKEKGEGQLVSAGKDGMLKYWDINRYVGKQFFYENEPMQYTVNFTAVKNYNFLTTNVLEQYLNLGFIEGFIAISCPLIG